MDEERTGRGGWWRLSDPLGWRAITRERASLTLLLMLLGAILYLVVRHLRAIGDEEGSLHFLDTPLGYPEAFQTLQWLWALGLVVLIAAGLRRWAFAALVPLLAFLLITDTFELHERFGRQLAEAIPLAPMLGLRARDVGELIVFAGAAVVTIPIALVGMRLARRADRPHFLRVFAILALVLLFGVALDMVHILLIEDAGPGDALGLLEDGGEMVGASLLVAYLFWVWLTRASGPEEPVGRARASAEPVMSD
ncbi:hypothetical protein [Agrococcus sp. HG114]|uniref:hypothetical protein n=1 Tax=Agrococcus sp. HG114 TaxID=2969757 RepID=UPI00215A7CAE|nr:hypothetical protein [Agrococcus sp. HG114]MCR8671293.1 hypothetical protein [Agrococcus sp. HG114]